LHGSLDGRLGEGVSRPVSMDQHHPDRQVAPARPGQQGEPGDQRLARQSRISQRPHVRVLMWQWRWPTLREGGQPGTVHGEWHRAGDVDDHRARLLDPGLPGLTCKDRHRPGVPPPRRQRLQACEGEHGKPAIASDQRRQCHLANLLAAQVAAGPGRVT
jgi:hypothetical protein